MLYLTETQVGDLLDMPSAIGALEDAFRELAEGTAAVQPRLRLRFPRGMLHLMAAALPSAGVVGYKSYVTTRAGGRFYCILYSTENGEPLVMMGADRLGQIRTGAASGVATKYLARQDASSVGIIGAGWQARSQLTAVCAVRPVRQVRVFSPTPERRQTFAVEMAQVTGVPIEPVAIAEDAVRDADIVITITSSRTPVFDGSALRPGTHINAAGSNADNRQEIDLETVRRSSLIVADHREQAKIECGDLIPAVAQGVVQWEQVVELADLVSGKAPGRQDDAAITLFESQGLALEDVAAGALVYRRARERGVGQEIALPVEA